MPKSPPSSPTENKLQQDDNTSRLSDVALRKKKNADAQAAFRARRANYIATLEETVTSLESVVLQLQDSCREARTEATELKQDNARLRHEFREREKFWRALWQAKKTGHGPELDDLPPLPAFAQPAAPMNAQLGSAHMQHYTNDEMAYRASDDPTACNNQYSTNSYSSHSPPMPYASPDIDPSGDCSSHSMATRVAKYAPYPYSMQGPGREGPWPSAITQSGSSGGESGGPSAHSSHSPGYTESPTMTSADMSFVNRYQVDEQKVPLSALESAPYVFSNSRSLSPSSTPSSSSSASLTSPFQFAFPPDGSLDRPDDYRRSHTGAEVTLHGGTADISLAGSGSDGLRYRLGARPPVSNSDRTPMPSLSSLSDNDHASQRDQNSADRDLNQRLRPRRGTAPARASHSPSPGPPPISGTLAVIKAQAFGALRRTRARTKKGSDGAARLAMDVLEARGIGMGVGAPPSNKRPRLDTDDDDMP
ncbi:hypothetical protein BDN71DRAFT_1423534 [Pleurotus eryngii]|uniref:BZIP domain-containing protein n=1 Tax=Pleurotus eryngii TaxID=5323 RepID=A0A9P5ZN37_PLEER|nr:hypothetical protein BDN71DRAFT_1423534 [Pleurotus eryngii]